MSLSFPVMNLVPPQLMSLLVNEHIIQSLISAFSLNVHILLTLPEYVIHVSLNYIVLLLKLETLHQEAWPGDGGDVD